MKAWIGDSFRFAWSLFYWNTRKSWYRLRKQRMTCPCQSPSDSGRGGETGCDAAITWNSPVRFKRVCPLLTQDRSNRWVCSVDAKDVRPFWGRALLYAGTAGGGVLVTAFLGVFVLMRVIGYDVTPRQLIWPPAWSELKAVRARLFIGQAQGFYEKGELRDAVRALSVGYQYDPSNYSAGRTLARFYEASNPVAADDLYAQLMKDHPASRIETARVWFRSLLVRGRFEDVITLARQGMLEDKEQTFAWTHALIFSATRLGKPATLEEVARDERYPAAVRQVVALAARTERGDATEAVIQLMNLNPSPASAYEVVYRIERLIDLNQTEQALALLMAARQQLDGRDVARLLLAAYATKGDRVRVSNEFDGLLSPLRIMNYAEFTLLAQHLVAHPDAILLEKLVNGMDRIAAEPDERKMEAYIILYCAAGVMQDKEHMELIKKRITSVIDNTPTMLEHVSMFFLAKPAARGKIENMLPALTPMPLDFIYTLMRLYN